MVFWISCVFTNFVPILVDLIFGGYIFYKYVFLAEQAVTEVTGTIIKFDNKTYQNVLNEFQTRELGDDRLSLVE